jgi:hypothetical protein
VAAQLKPLLFPEENDCDPAFGQVLLVADILIGREKDIEAGILRGEDQISILETVPTLLGGGDHFISGQKWAHRNRSCLIEQDALHGA